MRLNGSALNARPLNGDSRLAVFGVAEAIAAFQAELDGIRYQYGSGDAIHVLAGDFLAKAERFGGGSAPIIVVADIAQTVSRSGRGAAILQVDGDLYYSRTVYGSGGAEVSLLFEVYVGVVLIDGDVVILPCELELDANRKRPGAGDGALAVLGELDPSAIRRSESADNAVTVTGILEPSHIHDGVRYVGGFADAEMPIIAEDAGMIRQNLIGSADFYMEAFASGRIERPTLAGEAINNILLQSDFRASRRAEGSALMHVVAECDGEIFVRGDGQGIIRVVADGTGYKTTKVPLDAAVIGLAIDIDGRRKRPGSGDATLHFDSEMDGRRRLPGGGTAYIEVLGPSGGFNNVFAEDIEEQTFFRPAVQREFSRPFAVREWNRQ